MTDFEIIMQLLNSRFPDEETQPFYTEDGNQILRFPQNDVWYDTVFAFSPEGKLININGVSAN